MDGFAIAGSDALRDVRFGRNGRFGRASHFCANLTCIQCGALQLGLKVLDLNTEGFLKILGAQKLLPEVSVGCNLRFNAFLEGAYLILIGAWKGSHGPLDHIKVALRSGSHLFEIFKHRGSNGFERVFFGCHVTLPASNAIYRHRTVSWHPFWRAASVLITSATKISSAERCLKSYAFAIEVPSLRRS